VRFSPALPPTPPRLPAPAPPACLPLSAAARPAGRRYSAAVDTDPTNPHFPCNRAHAHNHLENYGQALADAEAAIALSPGYAKAYLRKAKALKGMGRMKDALRVYQASLRPRALPRPAAPCRALPRPAAPCRALPPAAPTLRATVFRSCLARCPLTSGWGQTLCRNSPRNEALRLRMEECNTIVKRQAFEDAIRGARPPVYPTL
jgi:tetratricopeptide (TPR) repeat protein